MRLGEMRGVRGVFVSNRHMTELAYLENSEIN